MARRRQWERMTRQTFLTAQMKDCLADIEAARKKGSMTVLSSLRKLAIVGPKRTSWPRMKPSATG